MSSRFLAASSNQQDSCIHLYDRTKGSRIHELRYTRAHSRETYGTNTWGPRMEMVGALLVSTGYYAACLCVWHMETGTLLKGIAVKRESAPIYGISCLSHETWDFPVFALLSDRAGYVFSFPISADSERKLDEEITQPLALESER